MAFIGHHMVSVFHQEVTQSGFPARALQFSEAMSQGDIEASSGWNVLMPISPLDRGIIIPPFLQFGKGADSRLPLRPIWPGLAFNTLFYALLWWLAFASIQMVKHNRRYRRGLCPLCRYDLLADYSKGCSECGWKR